MNVFKRAFLFCIRKRGKNLTLFLLFLLITSFITISFSVLDAVQDADANLRETIGASFSMQGNVKNVDFSVDKSDYTASFIPVLQKDVEAVAGIQGIKDYNAVQNASVSPVNFFFPSGMPYGMVSANTATKWNRNFTDGTLQLSAGRHIESMDQGTAIVSSVLAEENHLNLGDSLVLADYHKGKESGSVETDVQIVGIYESSSQMEFDDDYIFTDCNTFWTLTGASRDEYSGKVEFFVKDPAQMEQVIKEAGKIDTVCWDDYELNADNTEYDSISYQVSTIVRLTEILIAAVVVVSIIILLLILIMRIRNRVHEAGVLLAVGIGKGQIVFQFVLETLALLILAALFSGLVSSIAVVRIENALKSLSGMIDISVPVRNLILQYLIEAVTAVLGVLIAARSMMCLNPKDILSKMS